MSPLQLLRPEELRWLTGAPATATYSTVVQHYNVGELAPLSVRWTDATGAYVHPSTVSCKVLSPDGSVLTPSVTGPASDVYSAIAEPDKPGQWWYAFTASGGFQGLMQHLFVVRDSRL
jgi:hypothetical protein